MICFTERSDVTEDMRVDWTAILPFVGCNKIDITEGTLSWEQRAWWLHVESQRILVRKCVRHPHQASEQPRHNPHTMGTMDPKAESRKSPTCRKARAPWVKLDIYRFQPLNDRSHYRSEVAF